MKTIVPRLRLMSMEKSELVDGLIAAFLCGSIVRQGRCRVTSIPWIWLAQGRLTRENFDDKLATVLLLLIGYMLLAGLVELAIRFGRLRMTKLRIDSPGKASFCPGRFLGNKGRP